MILQTNSSKLDVVVITTAAHLQAIEAEWNALFDESPSASPPLRHKWVTEWWRVYGENYGNCGAGLRIITLRRGAKLVGVLPLYEGWRSSGGLKLRRVTFISAGAAQFEETSADYLDMLYRPGEEVACMDALARALLSKPFQWEFMQLPTVSHKSPLLKLADPLVSPTRSVHVLEHPGCHLFDMHGGFEEYLKRLSSENRRQARKTLRDVESDGLTFNIATDASMAGEYFDQMVDLHKNRWHSKGKAGSFAPRHSEFHRTVAVEGAASGAVAIARLSNGSRPIAVIYGHRVGNVLHCYQQGVDTLSKQKVRSPGTAAWLLMMREMAARGVTTFDHQKGSTAFKSRFSTGLHGLVEIQVRRIAPHALACGAADLTVRAVRRLGRILGGTVKPHVDPEIADMDSVTQ